MEWLWVQCRLLPSRCWSDGRCTAEIPVGGSRPACWRRSGAIEMSSLSVLVLTKNEERDLSGCLNSVSWCDDVHVLDSGSADNTCDIAVGEVGGFLDHYPFSKGVSHWLERQYAYSSLEARQIIENRRVQASFSVYQALMAGDFHERRFHQKELFYRMPVRPFGT